MRYMCINACAVLLIGGRAGPFYRFTDSWSITSLLRVGHRVATLLDSTRESILALRYNFWRLQGTQSWSVSQCKRVTACVCLRMRLKKQWPTCSGVWRCRHESCNFATRRLYEKRQITSGASTILSPLV